MTYFDEATLRLKQQLKVHLDKDVAELLGLSKRAWVGRKKSGNFPQTELFALSAKRPDLGIDVPYVITGTNTVGTTNTTAEAHLLECYRLLDERQKLAVNRLVSTLSGVVD